MQIALSLGQRVLVQFLMIAVGYLLTAAHAFRPEDAAPLSRLILYVVMPCTILNAFRMDLTPEILADLCVALALGMAAVFVLALLGRLLRRPLHLSPAEESSLCCANSGNMIIPLIASAMGQQWVAYIIGFVIGTNLLMFTYCISIIRGTRGVNVRQVLCNPNMIAIAVSLILLFAGWQLPGMAQDVIDDFAAMFAPGSMLVIGLALGSVRFSTILKKPRYYLLAAIRLVGMPLVILTLMKLCRVYRFAPDARQIALIVFICASSCSATSISQLTQCYAKDPQDMVDASALNVLTVGFLLVTLPLMVLLFELWI
jgi:predicted permease